ncbi:MAG: hypothetical protein K2J77_06810 [Oscillospiraceae bacterium]|nr:hypothetical protein [Oscillospiraceae bacterium]
MTIKKNFIVAAAAALSIVMLAGCADDGGRAAAPYTYDAPGASDSSSAADTSVSYGSSEPDSDSSIAAAESEIKPSGIICTVDWDSSDSVPAATSSDSSVSGIAYPDISYSASRESADSVPAASPSDTAPVSVSGSASAIKQICGLKSKVETDIGACIVDTYSDHNPYDVAYDYGKDYDAFVGACDWSLVFDADFYAESFPPSRDAVS